MFQTSIDLSHLDFIRLDSTKAIKKFRFICHCENFQDIRDAILREKQIKAGNRKKKIELIESQNPEWKDLFKNEF